MMEYSDTPQVINATYDEDALVYLSIKQNGAASIQRKLDDKGEVQEFLSAFKIDLRGYTSAVAARLDLVKADLKAQVDAKAEALRLTLITPGSGQAMEYQEAYAQAQDALAATGDLKASDYPMLAATIGVDIDPDSGKPAADVLGVARSVKAAYEAYLKAGAAIRGARLLAKVEIDAAPDVGLARAVFDAIEWPATA